MANERENWNSTESSKNLVNREESTWEEINRQLRLGNAEAQAKLKQ